MSKSKPLTKASPNGRGEPLPELPYTSQRFWPMRWASAFEESEYEPTAPPRERMTLTPLAWHCLMDAASVPQFWPSPDGLM